MTNYYTSRSSEILATFDEHACSWRPFLGGRYGEGFAGEVIGAAREVLAALLPELPDIGGDENPMTRHLVRSTTSLALYKAMQARGKSAAETGRIVYEAVSAVVARLPAVEGPTAAEIEAKKEEVARSRQFRHPGGWVWEFVAGDGVEFDYGYDFRECGTHKLYLSQGAAEFLPYYCYLDFVTHRTRDWGFSRSETLSEGHDRCAFRWKKGGMTAKGWPPPFAPR